MLSGDSADTCTEKFLLMSMGGRADGLACFDPGVRTLIGLSGIFLLLSFLFSPAVTKIPEGVCPRVLNHLQKSSPTPQKSYPKFRNPRTTCENTHPVGPKMSCAGGRVSNFFLGWNPNIFYELEAHAKFRIPRTTFQPPPTMSPQKCQSGVVILIFL